MKRLIALLTSVLVIASCATTRYAHERYVTEMDEVSYILANYYPQLHYYLMEGVLRVNSIKEVQLEDGTIDYKVKYNFVKYHYPEFNDRMANLEKYFPDLYKMYISGVVEITSFYKYVDKNTGEVRHHASYRRV